MSKVNELDICKEDYQTQEEFENAVKNAVMLLLDANYTMVIRYDDKSLGIIVIEFNPAKRELGARYPNWLLPEEEESVVWEE